MAENYTFCRCLKTVHPKPEREGIKQTRKQFMKTIRVEHTANALAEYLADVRENRQIYKVNIGELKKHSDALIASRNG